MKRYKGVFVSLVVMLLWGLLFPLVKLGYQVFEISSVGDTLAFAGFRFLVCGAVVTLFAACTMPGSLKGLKKTWKLVLLAGVFSVVLHYGLSYVGMRTTDGSKTAILKQMGAVFYICCAGLFFPEEKLSPSRVGGLLLGVLGIFAINTDMGGFQFHMGDLLILGASFGTVFSSVIGKKVLHEVTPILLCGVSQLFGGAVLLAVGVLAGGSVQTVTPETPEQLAVLGMIAAASVVSYCLWYICVQKEKLSGLFMIKFSEPLFAAVFSWAILGEDIFQINYLIAFLFISAGIAAANQKTVHPESKKSIFGPGSRKSGPGLR